MRGLAVCSRVPDGAVAGQSIARQMQRNDGRCMPDRPMLRWLLEGASMLLHTKSMPAARVGPAAMQQSGINRAATERGRGCQPAAQQRCSSPR